MDELNLIFYKRLLLAILLAGSSFFVFGQDEIKTPVKDTASKEIKNTQEKAESTNPYQNKELNLHSIGVAVGQTFLHGDMSDNGENQVTFEGYYDYTASYSFDFVANAHLSKHKYQGLYSQISGLALSIKGKFFDFDSFSPFVLGGLGFYMPKQKRNINGQIRESESKITLGTNLGLGAELVLNKHAKLWLILHHHNPFDLKQEVGPEIEGRYTKLLMAGFYTF